MKSHEELDATVLNASLSSVDVPLSVICLTWERAEYCGGGRRYQHVFTPFVC